MPTYAQLAREPAWNAEFAPSNLDQFYRWLRDFYNMTAQWIGGKGDNNHIRGYHRSRRWIKESQYSRDHAADYSIQHELDQGGDENWLAALDASLPANRAVPNSPLYAACRRVDEAVRAGLLPQVREYYGTFDGVTVVGYDTAKGRPASSDKSHLGHLHISFYRSRANDDQTLLYETITGTGGTGMTVIARYGDKGEQVGRAQTKHREVDPSLPESYVDKQYGNNTRDTHKRLVGAGDGTIYTTGDEALYNTILLQRGGTGGGLTEAQVREIAEQEAEEAIGDATVTTTIKPGE